VCDAAKQRRPYDVESMQPEQIILLPPTHEQSNPSFHIAATIADAFLSFVSEKNIPTWRTPLQLEKTGPDGQRLVEVEVEAGTPVASLEKLMNDFWKTRPQ